jgi:hypothetical protein
MTRGEFTINELVIEAVKIGLPLFDAAESLTCSLIAASEQLGRAPEQMKTLLLANLEEWLKASHRSLVAEATGQSIDVVVKRDFDENDEEIKPRGD